MDRAGDRGAQARPAAVAVAVVAAPLWVAEARPRRRARGETRRTNDATVDPALALAPLPATAQTSWADDGGRSQSWLGLVAGAVVGDESPAPPSDGGWGIVDYADGALD